MVRRLDDERVRCKTRDKGYKTSKLNDSNKPVILSGANEAEEFLELVREVEGHKS